MTPRSPAAVLGLALAIAYGPATYAQNEGYPNRPVRLIIPYSPGGASDNIARLFVPRLAEALRQTIVIDNRPGGAGSIGRNMVAKATPDGYTLLSTHRRSRKPGSPA